MRSVIPVIIAQIITGTVAIVYYEELYTSSEYGAACLFSGLCSGLSQGLVQMFSGRGLRLSLLFKFYVWGVFNGLWTKFWTDSLSVMISQNLVKVIVDQLVGNPICIFGFASFSAFWDGVDVDAFLDKNYFVMLRSSYTVWPLASMMVFYVLSKDLVVPFNAVVNLVWTIMLSVLSQR